MTAYQPLIEQAHQTVMEAYQRILPKPTANQSEADMEAVLVRELQAMGY